MVHNLSSLGRKAQIFVHFVIEESANASCSKAESFGGEIHSLTDGAGFEMNVSISSIAVNAGSAFEIADHGKCHTSVPCQVLPQAERCGCQALISLFDIFQLRALRPVAISSRRQTFHAVDVKI